MDEPFPLMCAGCGEREIDDDHPLYCDRCMVEDPFRLDEDWQEDRDEEALN